MRWLLLFLGRAFFGDKFPIQLVHGPQIRMGRVGVVAINRAHEVATNRSDHLHLHHVSKLGAL